MPWHYRGGQKKILGVSRQRVLGKEGFSLPGSLILSTLERCARGMFEGQCGEEACSERTGLLRGREGLCVQNISRALFTAAGVGWEMAKGREMNRTR